MLVVTFLGLITGGTLGLKLLPGLYTADKLGWLDALFTATSASCVTGLVVVDTATHFTFAGQAFLLLLIQAGGLGMLGLASLIIVTLNSRLSLRQDVLAGGSGTPGGAAAHVKVRSLVRDVFIFTALAEGIGFVLLFGLWTIWPIREGIGAGETAWHALFHAISAFCNAGFSTFSDSLMGMQNRPMTQIVIMGGCISGALGFLTLEEIKLWVQARRRKKSFRLSLHTRLVLVTFGILLLIGWAAAMSLEWANNRTLGPLAVQDKIVNALFCSMTPRTAGFNTVDFDETLPATKFITILLMSIGGAPGGTAGGMKVTTIGILAAMAIARFRGRPTTDLWDRTLPSATTQRAVGLFAFSFTVMTAGLLLLTITELGAYYPGDQAAAAGVVESRHDFLDHMFEAASAANTVGLSTGPTPDLSPAGRFLLVLLMFIGRVGPLTFAAALSRDDPNQRLVKRYAQEDVIVG